MTARRALPSLLVVPLLLAACGSVAAPSAGPASTSSAGAHAASHSARPGHGFSPVNDGTTEPKTAVAAVCAGAHAVSQVGIKAAGIRRMGELQPRMRLRYDWMITNPAKASALAISACALPLMPRVVSCPNQTGADYELAFSAAGRQFPVVTVQVTGCMQATGLGAPRSAGRSTAGNFWTLLSADTKMPPPVAVPRIPQ